MQIVHRGNRIAIIIEFLICSTIIYSMIIGIDELFGGNHNQKGQGVALLCILTIAYYDGRKFVDSTVTIDDKGIATKNCDFDFINHYILWSQVVRVHYIPLLFRVALISHEGLHVAVVSYTTKHYKKAWIAIVDMLQEHNPSVHIPPRLLRLKEDQNASQ